MAMAVSCGGIVVCKGKVLLLYKNQKDRSNGWVLPKGTLEHGETFCRAALREVLEEAGVAAKIIKFVGDTNYTFRASGEVINKTVHWYLMRADSFYCKPQLEEYFIRGGYYNFEESVGLLKYSGERMVMKKALEEYGECNL